MSDLRPIGRGERPSIPAPERLCLFLDLDGTLAPIADDPAAVGPDGRRTALLHALEARLGGRLAVLSGRPLPEIDRIGGGAVGAAAGTHGLELRLPDGAVDAPAPHAGLDEARRRFEAFAAADPGLLVEHKALSVGLHYRRAPARSEAAQALADQLVAETGLTLQSGSMVVELKTPGADKGEALRRLMAVEPFVGGVPVMVGDDLTDEAAFAAAAELGGFGVLVGPERDTVAAARLDDVAATLDWLEGLAALERAA
ncbi:MAG TPA: trehalose-phosphatase [Caulobacteraceae bacterium]